MSYFFRRYAQAEQYELLIVDNALETISKGRNPTYGDTIQFKVPRRADLLSKLFLKIVLPPTYLYSSLIRDKTETFALYSLVEYVELIIGGQLIERLTGEFIFNYLKLYLGPNELVALEQTTEMKINDLKKDYASFGQFVLLPLPFYFFDNKGYEIPLVALTRQNVTMNIKLTNKPPITGLPELSDVTVTAEYIILGSETTKNAFVKNGMMYRVTQVQMNSTTALTSETVKVMDLNFQNPVREIFVCIQPSRYQTLQNGNFFHYFCNYRNSYVNYKNEDTGYYLSEHHITGASLRFNGNYIFQEESGGSAQMMCYTIPQKYYNDADNTQLFRGYVYPFVLDPLSKQPQGHINMSRILKKQLTLYLNTSQFDRNIRVYARSYNIMVIKDGLCGLMFTNPSYYNPTLVSGTDVAVSEGTVPTGLPDLTADQGYYYAIKVTNGNEIVGVQLYEDDTPQFVTPRDLQDTQFSYMLDTNDTFVSNTSVILTNTNIYVPGTISQLLYTAVNAPAVTSNVDKYSMTSTDNYIFSSQYGFVKSMRLILKTTQATPLSSLSLDTNTEQSLYTNLLTTATVNLYRSNTFFNTTAVDTWIAGAQVDTRTIRIGYTKESSGFYYAALVTRNSGGNITSYSKVNFARTYDFVYTFAVIPPTSDTYDSSNNISNVTLQVTGLSGSGTIRAYNGSRTRGPLISFTTADTSNTYTFTEPDLRTTQTYTVVITRSLQSTLTRTFSLTAGVRSGSAYYVIQYITTSGTGKIVALQGYSDTPGGWVQKTLNKKTMVTSNVIPLALSNTTGTTGVTLYAQNFSNIINTITTSFADQSATQYSGDTGASSSTSIGAVNMGAGNYIYTKIAMSASYFIIALDVTTVPATTSTITISSSSSIFTPASPSTWLAGATTKTYELGTLTSQATSSTSFEYKTDQRYLNTSMGRLVEKRVYTANTYYLQYDIVAPIFISKYKNVGIASEDTVTMTRGTSPATFIQYNNDNAAGLAIWTDDTYVNTNYSTRIQESNNIVYNTVGNYTITFVATDTNLNSRTLTLYVAVV